MPQQTLDELLGGSEDGQAYESAAANRERISRMRSFLSLPAPGSDAAIEAGCTCPVMDNSHGEGIPGSGGNVFWFNCACMLHYEMF